MNAATSQQGNPPAHVQMFQLLNGYFVSGVISCVAQLGIPDLLEQGPKSAAELATQIGAEPGTLYRLMRASACVGVLSEGPDGKFSQTPLSAVLRTSASPSLRAFSMMHNREWHARGWAALEYCVRTGKQSVEKNYGMDVFEYFKQHPDESELFNQSMTDLSSVDSPAVADAYSFSGINSIVDLAGGHGHLLATILSRNPHMRGTLFDLPHVI
jgi:C-methyltransferase